MHQIFILFLFIISDLYDSFLNRFFFFFYFFSIFYFLSFIFFSFSIFYFYFFLFFIFYFSFLFFISFIFYFDCFLPVIPSRKVKPISGRFLICIISFLWEIDIKFQKWRRETELSGMRGQPA